VRQLSVGEGYLCTLSARGLSCARLGEPSQPRGTLPRPLLDGGRLDAPGVTYVGAGFGRACAVHGGGWVRCWGYDPRRLRERRNDPEEESTRPTDIAGISDAVRVSVGEWHACALRRTGAVACWGRNDFGQLGRAAADRAVDILGIADAADVAAARGYACALLRSGEVACWGGGSVTGLGGAPTARAVPRAVTGIIDAVQLAAGPYHACVVKRSGEVSCWGYNGAGALGDGTTQDRAGPVGVPGIHDAAEVAAGAFHTCVRRRSGEVACWGREIDDGTSHDREAGVRVPVKVTFEAPR
jgi:alpha-tubulin suppressor-like RCC1 family protein